MHPDGKWQCYGKCDRSGDVLDLDRALHGGTTCEAVERLGGRLVPVPITRTPKRDNALRPTKKNPLALPYELSIEERLSCARYVINLEPTSNRPHNAELVKANG